MFVVAADDDKSSMEPPSKQVNEHLSTVDGCITAGQCVGGVVGGRNPEAGALLADDQTTKGRDKSTERYGVEMDVIKGRTCDEDNSLLPDSRLTTDNSYKQSI